jgi:hypothetical protein
MKKSERYLIIVVTFLLVCSGCMSSRNAEAIRNYENPASEFKGEAGILRGTIFRNDEKFLLEVNNLLAGKRTLSLEFPAQPNENGRDFGKANILSESEPMQKNGVPVEVEIFSGKFDNSNNLDNKMILSNGVPTRVILGIYWNVTETGNNHVEFTVGYKYAPEKRFATASCPCELAWSNRSHVHQAGNYAKYIITGPADLFTSPIQGLLYGAAPKGLN